MEFGKKFVIIGNENAITYKDIFKFIKENRLWLGVNRVKSFRIPDDNTTNKNVYIKNGIKYAKFGNVIWFTNLDIKKRHEVLETIYSYAKTPEKYPKYDNYDAINVDKIAEIPMDYDGVIGVPITFLDKYNPEQFEILGDSRYHDGQDFPDDINFVNGKGLYRRILIQKRKGEK